MVNFNLIIENLVYNKMCFLDIIDIIKYCFVSFGKQLYKCFNFYCNLSDAILYKRKYYIKDQALFPVLNRNSFFNQTPFQFSN